jgi:hypothetical protein
MVVVVLLAGCKTTHKTGSTERSFLSSKVQLTIPLKSGEMTVNGSMKMVSGQGVQLSFTVPILGNEAARMEITPDTLTVVDRMGRRYVQASREELKDVLPRKANFQNLEKLLRDASKPGGKHTLSGEELGIPSLEKARLSLTNFSDKEFIWNPTRVSSRYTRIDWKQLLEQLLNP